MKHVLTSWLTTRLAAWLAVLPLAIGSPAAAQDFSPASLIGTQVFADPSARAPAIGRVVDLYVVDGVITALLVTGEAGTGIAPIDQAQIYAGDAGFHLVVARDDILPEDQLDPRSTPYRNLSEESRDAVFLREQALDLTFYGGDAASDLIETLVQVRKQFDVQAFRTREYTVRPGDTVCAIYGRETQLPLNAKRCPRRVEDLDRLLNPGTRLVPGAVLEIPSVAVNDFNDRQSDFGMPNSGVSGLYSLRLPVTTRMAFAFYDAFSFGRQISVEFTTAGAGQEKGYHSRWLQPSPDLACAPQPDGVSVEKSYYYLFSWLADKGWKPPDAIVECAMDCDSRHPDDPGACADLVLVDQEVTRLPDLSRLQVLDRFGQPVDAGPALASASCTTDPVFDRNSQHGTHLASIIDSRSDGSGFVGMSPGLDVFAYPWTANTTTTDLLTLIGLRIGTPDSTTFAQLGPQVFVFASHFPPLLPHSGPPPKTSYPQSRREGLRLSRTVDGRPVPIEELRFEPTLQKSIKESESYNIWVVSAMQKESDGGLTERMEIDASLAFSPANLGDLPNVIVVTACEECDEGNASIWPDAFYGKKFVQVAAPGMNVIAPVAPGKLAVGGGTSQAAAIVGGLVGAMLNCYPDRYRESEGQSHLKSAFLKQRLQYTSKPIFYRRNDLESIAAGVVDPEVALLDPGRNWIRLAGAVEYQDMTGDGDVRNWCRENWQMVDQGLATQTNGSRNILRMVRIANPQADGGRSWVIYSYDPEDKSGIVRFDPRVFLDPDGENLPLLARKDGSLLFPKDFDDLVLARTLGPGPCSGD